MASPAFRNSLPFICSLLYPNTAVTSPSLPLWASLELIFFPNKNKKFNQILSYKSWLTAKRTLIISVIVSQNKHLPKANIHIRQSNSSVLSNSFHFCMVNAEHLARNRTAAANYLENEFNKPPRLRCSSILLLLHSLTIRTRIRQRNFLIPSPLMTSLLEN